MLARMLLHVIEATVNVNQTMNAAAFLKRSCIVENMEDLAVLSFRHIGHAQFVARLAGKNPTRIESLPAAGGIEGSSIQDNGGTRFGIRSNIQHLSVEFT
jgi:hypothetical protein